MWIVAYGSYNEEEKAIDIEWYSSEEADYEVLFSDDNNDYTSLIRENKYTFYHYRIEKDFDIRYFRVDLISDGKYVESIPFAVKRTASGYITEPLDSDEDGLSDITELKIGTDINKPDTDDDGLSDLQEFTITFTDPLDPNSVHPNFTDAEADRDGDGLSNADEIMHDTNPVNADTDDDHLSDGDEINLYGTDPLDPDTDEDEISDGDEIALGYDPKAANADIKTKTIEQHLDKDSTVFAEINTDENAFDISMDITAAGYAPRTLIAKVSPYENAVANDAIVGVVPEFIYPNDLSMSEITLNFEVKDEFIANTNGKYAAVSSDFEGIKRFSVFKYFEEYGLLLPIETTYDTENDTVKTTVDEVGTYCLVDVEKWFDSLEIDPAKFESVVLSPDVVGMTGIPFNKTILSVGSADVIEDAKLRDKNIDIVFNVFVNSSSPKHVYDQARLFGETIFDNCDDSCSVHIYVVNYKGDVIPSGYLPNDYISSKDEWDFFFDNKTITKDGRTYEPEIDTTIAAFFNKNSLRAYADKYYVAIESEPVEHKKLENAVNRLIQEDVCALVGANGAMDQHRSLAEITGGQFYNKLNLYGVPMAEYIIDFTRKKTDGQVYKTITSTGLKVITLDAPITEDYLAALRNNVDMSEYADQDEDGLRDLEELRYFIGSKQMITWDNQGNVVLPTFEECLDLVAAEPYIKHAFSQYKGWDMSFMNNWRVLPVKSDPTDADTDKDYAPDGIEKERSTDPLSTDTDGDGLSDGREMVLTFDPTSANSDEDDYNDLDEYFYGLDPFSYDDNYIDLGAQFVDGFIRGDFIEDKTIANVVGQITASLLPYTGKISDFRDFFAAIFSGDAKSIATSLFSAIPGHGDLVKGGKELSKFISKHADDFPKVAKTIEKVTTKFPVVAKYIDPKAIDNAADGLKSCTKLTKRNYVQLKKTFNTVDKAFEVHKDYDRLLKCSQRILDSSGKAEEFFDTLSKDSDGDDGDDGDGGDGDGNDGDGDAEDDDELTKAIKESKHYIDNLSQPDNIYRVAYSPELVTAFYNYANKYNNASAIQLVKKTKNVPDELIDTLNNCGKRLFALELYDTYGEEFAEILVMFGDKADNAIIAIYSSENKRETIRIIKKFIINYGDSAIDICSKVNDQVLVEIIKYDEPAMEYLVQGLTVDSTRISNLLNQLSETNIEKCKTVIALIAERPEETPEDLLDVFSHEYIEGVIMYLDNLSSLPENMDDVWKMTPTERGVMIENYYAATEYRTWYHIGAEYNGYFPIIDFQKDDVVVSMKSLDPRLPSYSNSTYFRQTIRKYLYSLSKSEIKIAGKSPNKRILDLVFPSGTISNEIENTINDIHANYPNVEINLKEI